MKFKLGDFIKIKKCTQEDCTECKDEKGMIVEINLDREFPYVISFDDDYDPDHENEYGTEELALLKSEEVKYLAIFDEGDKDPVKTFPNLYKLKKWLSSALSDKNIVYGSIRVFGIKDEYQVQNLVSIQKIAKK